MEAEPWEALDLDDSDLPSLLRPCKRRRSTTPTTTADSAAAANPLSQSPEENHTEELQQQPVPSTSHQRTIPGPAGAVQAAIFRKNRDRGNQNFSNHREDNCEDFNGNRHNDGVISTQDYIQRAMEDIAEFDDDFTRHPWLSALQFVGAEGGMVQCTPISSIKKCLNAGKVVKVVAVIKSCTPNGLGGLIVLLKDPTGTIGASIHHKVLSESEFGKKLTIGAVLILQEVAIFASLRSAHYLNITLKNLVKVFCQNSGSTPKLNKSAYPTQYADLGIGYCGKAKTMEKSTMQNVTMEDIEWRQCMRKSESLQNPIVIQKQNLFAGNAQSNNRASINVNAARTGHINLSQDACNEIPEDIIRTKISTGDHQEFVNGSDKGAKVGNLEGGSLLNDTNNTANSVTEGTGEEIQGTSELQMQRLPQLLKASLPEWTDEQLDQLFASDEDDGSLF